MAPNRPADALCLANLLFFCDMKGSSPCFLHNRSASTVIRPYSGAENAARCIGHRSALRGHMQRTAFSAHPPCPILHISLPRKIHSPTLSPSERFEARQDVPKRPQKHICCTRTGAMPPPSGNIAPVPMMLYLMPTIQPGCSMHKGHFCLRASICSWNLRTSLG